MGGSFCGWGYVFIHLSQKLNFLKKSKSCFNKHSAFVQDGKVPAIVIGYFLKHTGFKSVLVCSVRFLIQGPKLHIYLPLREAQLFIGYECTHLHEGAGKYFFCLTGFHIIYIHATAGNANNVICRTQKFCFIIKLYGSVSMRFWVWVCLNRRLVSLIWDVRHSLLE